MYHGSRSRITGVNIDDFNGTGVSFKAIYTYIACYLYFMSIITNPMFGLKL
jgi:hypothetical protein